MAQLTTSAGPIDHARVCRALLAWRTGDEPAFHRVMNEVINDPSGVAQPGMLFACFAQNSALVDQLGVREELITSQLRARIAELTLLVEQQEPS